MTFESLSQHRKDFDDLYSGVFGEQDNQLRFPLEDVEKLDWGRGRYANAYYNYMYRRFSSHILSRLSLSGSENILILGCGVGSDEKNIKGLFPNARLWSVDISRPMLQAALASQSPSVFAVAAAEALPFPERCFDRVLSREVIEHVLDPQAMLREVRRVLKPGGIAVITTENEDSIAIGNRPYERTRSFVYRALGVRSPTAIHSFKDEAPTVEEVRSWSHAAGLQLIDVFCDGALYKTLPWLQKIVRDRKLASLAHRLSGLENVDKLAFYFCDQVKFVLRRAESLAEVASNEPRFCRPGTSSPLVLEGEEYVCGDSGERFSIEGGIPELLPVSNAGASVRTSSEELGAVEARPAKSWFRRVRRLVAAGIMRALSFVYLVLLVVSGLVATIVVPANRDRPSHILKEGDPYLRFIHI